MLQLYLYTESIRTATSFDLMSIILWELHFQGITL